MQSVRVTLYIMLAASLVSCEAGGLTRNDEPLPPEDRGVRVLLPVRLIYPHVRWSADGSRLFVIADTAAVNAPYVRTLFLVNPETAVATPITSSNALYEVRGSAAYSTISAHYLSAEGEIRRVSLIDGSTEVIATRVGSAGWSRDGRFFAYNRRMPSGGPPDSLMLGDASTGMVQAVRAAVTAGMLLGVSPDGSLILVDDYSAGYNIVAANGTSRAFAAPQLQLPSDHVWMGGQLHLLLSLDGSISVHRFADWNEATQTQSVLASYTEEAALDFPTPLWAPEASVLVLQAYGECYRSTGAFSCNLYHVRFLVAGPAANREIASINAQFIDDAAISPNGKWIAYAYAGDVYVKQTGAGAP